jgi:hypothetical protein
MVKISMVSKCSADHSRQARKLRLVDLLLHTVALPVVNAAVTLPRVGADVGAGYSEFQLTDDSGSDVTPLNAGAKDRVFAFGPEFDVILPPQTFNFMVRVLPEFGARSRTRGVTLVFAIGKSF